MLLIYFSFELIIKNIRENKITRKDKRVERNTPSSPRYSKSIKLLTTFTSAPKPQTNDKIFDLLRL